jgi:high frequency lysogenization protein
MSSTRIAEQTLALAALFQAAALVRDIATGGRYDEADLQTCLNGILETSPQSMREVYGEPRLLQRGLRVLQEQLGNDAARRNIDIARYVIALLHLERKLQRKPALLQQIGEGLERVRSQLQHYPLSHANVLANLAGIYSDTISTLPPKIMVNGEQQHLANPDHVNRIRALLLAGMRAAVLWRQIGGRRWHVLFKRKAILGATQQLLTGGP